MAVNVVDFINKIQEEGLTTLKQTQEASLAAMGNFRKFGNELSEKPGTIPTFENMPTPTQLVELSFGFASQFLEVRKAYTLKVAELIAEAQKTAETTVKNTVAQANVQMNQSVAQATNGAAQQTAGSRK
jgi:hypothetical protein